MTKSSQPRSSTASYTTPRSSRHRAILATARTRRHPHRTERHTTSPGPHTDILRCRSTYNFQCLLTSPGTPCPEVRWMDIGWDALAAIGTLTLAGVTVRLAKSTSRLAEQAQNEVWSATPAPSENRWSCSASRPKRRRRPPVVPAPSLGWTDGKHPYNSPERRRHRGHWYYR